MTVAISGLSVDEQSTGRDKFSGSSQGFDGKQWWNLGCRPHRVRTSGRADPCLGEKLYGGTAVREEAHRWHPDPVGLGGDSGW